MRISDWSSDVCSSDLELCGGRLHLLDLLEHALHLLMLFERLAYVGPVALANGRVEYGFLEFCVSQQLVLQLVAQVQARLLRAIGRVLQQIGRASCRERVCPYV